MREYIKYDVASGSRGGTCLFTVLLQGQDVCQFKEFAVPKPIDVGIHELCADFSDY